MSVYGRLQSLTANQFKWPEIRKAVGISFDGTPNRFEVSGVVVDHRQPCDHSGCSNYAVEPPSGETFTPGLHDFGVHAGAVLVAPGEEP